MTSTPPYKFYEVVFGICQLNCPKDCGYAIISQYPEETMIELHFKNLPPGKHGFHIHQSADLRKGCDSLGGHYNPHHGTHKDINKQHNHLGDLGNIEINEQGECNQIIHVKNLPLVGENQVIGRSMVVHENKDDLGLGGDKTSKENGNSGKRIACGIIGYL